MTYIISGGKTLNMVLSHIDRSDPTTWKSEDDQNGIKQEFADWDNQYVQHIYLPGPFLSPDYYSNY